MENRSFPSLKELRCPNCSGTEHKILGTKGATGKVVGDIMFGALGSLVHSSDAKNDFELHPIRYQCLECKKKYESLPLTAPEEELLEAPCTVVLHRLSSFVGMAVLQQVFLNGVKVGNVKNNQELSFQTYTKHNVVFVTDHSGVAFADTCTFTAESGGRKALKFNRKFV